MFQNPFMDGFYPPQNKDIKGKQATVYQEFPGKSVPILSNSNG